MIIASRCALALLAAVMSVSHSAYASEAGRPPGVNPTELPFVPFSDAMRLFDSPSAKMPSGQLAVSGDSSAPQPATPTGSSGEVLLQFDGVLSHNNSTEIWLDGLPMSLWLQRQLVQTLSVRWAPATNTLVVRLPGGAQRRLLAGQRLYRTANGKLQVEGAAP